MTSIVPLSTQSSAHAANAPPVRKRAHTEVASAGLQQTNVMAGVTENPRKRRRPAAPPAPTITLTAPQLCTRVVRPTSPHAARAPSSVVTNRDALTPAWVNQRICGGQLRLHFAIAKKFPAVALDELLKLGARIGLRVDAPGDRFHDMDAVQVALRVGSRPALQTLRAHQKAVIEALGPQSADIFDAMEETATLGKREEFIAWTEALFTSLVNAGKSEELAQEQTLITSRLIAGCAVAFHFWGLDIAIRTRDMAAFSNAHAAAEKSAAVSDIGPVCGLGSAMPGF